MTLETRLPRLAKSFSPVQLRAHLSQPSPTPLLLSDLIPEADWPASRSWSLTNGLSRLRSVIGENREVDVELGPRGRGYLDKGYKRIGMGFGLFLDAFILDRIPSSIPLHQRPTGYLAQYDLDPGSELATIDAPVLPHYTCGPRSEIWRRALWIGPGGSWTPFHRDPYINIYTHLIGKKKFWLLPPSSAGYLDISPSHPHTNTSTIPISVSAIFPPSSSSSPKSEAGVVGGDISDITVEKMDRYKDLLTRAFDVDGACEVELREGESVLVPEGWWHSAEGISTGIGVNAWFR